MSNRNSDWPLVVLVLGILAFVGAMTIAGYPQAMWGLFVLLVIFFL
mgnify:CR=1 FL=1